jgi:predicted acetyltransferase
MLREGLSVVRADPGQDPILRNLFEFYLHDMAEWFRFDQLPDGRYTHSTDPYWEADHDVYLLHAQDIPIGFGLIGPADQWLPEAGARDMDEFFVVRRHRRSGIGREFAEDLWRRYPGRWLVRVFQPNRPALPFWRQAVTGFTGGRFVEQILEKNGNLWSHFLFQSEARSEGGRQDGAR